MIYDTFYAKLVPNGAIGTKNTIYLIIRSTGKVLGHGGYKPYAPHNQEFLGSGDGNNKPVIGGNGGNALGTSLTDGFGSGNSVICKIISGGVLSGGGGGGGSGGSSSTAALTPVFCPLMTYGGGGAPFGGRTLVYNGDTNDPICPDNFSYYDPGAMYANCTTDEYRYEASFGECGTLTSPGNPLPRETYDNGNVERDHIGGVGGNYGQSGSAGYTWRADEFPPEDLIAMSRPGVSGSITTVHSITYDNNIN
jgi:hypothetical protein